MRGRLAGILRQTQTGGGSGAEQGIDAIGVGQGLQADLAAQFEAFQTRQEILGPGAFNIDQQRLARPDHDEIMQEFALRGQQALVDGPVSGDAGDVIADQPLQKSDGIGAADGDQAAIGKRGEGK